MQSQRAKLEREVNNLNRKVKDLSEAVEMVLLEAAGSGVLSPDCYNKITAALGATIK